MSRREGARTHGVSGAFTSAHRGTTADETGRVIGSHVRPQDPLAAAEGADVVQIFLGNPQSWKPPSPRGARVVIVHGGYVSADDVEAGFSRWCKALDRLETTVPIYLENAAGGDHAMARRFDTIAKLWDFIGDTGVGFCLDTCHTWASGEGQGLLDAVDRIKAASSPDIASRPCPRRAGTRRRWCDDAVRWCWYAARSPSRFLEDRAERDAPHITARNPHCAQPLMRARPDGTVPCQRARWKSKGKAMSSSVGVYSRAMDSRQLAGSDVRLGASGG